MRKQFDLVVVGTGAAGANAAYGVRKAGWNVAIIDERPFGGTCALRGCDPKKVLVGAAELIDWADRMKLAGVAGDLRIDWQDLMRFKRSFTEPVPADREAGFQQAGIETYHGRVRFVDRTSIRVGEDVLKARYVVIGTGAKPAPLHIAGEEHLITSEQFLELDVLPKRVAFVGGGYIAFEFAHVSARAGATPIILQRGDRVLTGFDPTLVDGLVDVTRSIGIDLRTSAPATYVEKTPSGFRVYVGPDGRGSAIDCDLVVHAAGRVADIDDLDVAAGDIHRTAKGIAVNPYLQSVSNPNVYAAGDAADDGGLPLTPVAVAQGETVAHNLLEPNNRRSVDYAGLASIVYTIPALGMAGLTKAQAHERGIAFSTHAGDSTEWYSSRRIRSRRSAYSVLIDKDSERIIGAHVLGPHTEELINAFSLAIRESVPAKRVGEVLFGYPTASSDIAYMVE